MIPRMTVLLEAAHGNPLVPIIVGAVVFLTLMLLLSILISFGSARPHTES